MRINKVFLAGIALLLGVFIYALNYSTHWYDFAGYSSFTTNDSNNAVVELKKEQSLFSISIPSNVLLEDDFEGATSNWTFTTTSEPAKWHIGTAVKSSGLKSLYVSEDNGVTNGYSTGSTTIHAISPSVTLDNTTTDYLFSFDWRAKAESTWDFLSLWLVPDTYTPQGGSVITASASGGIELATVSGKEDFKNVNFIKDLSAFKGMKVKVVFQWKHDSSGYNNPPGAVDNFEFAKITCKAPSLDQLKVSNVSLTGAQFDWTTPDATITDFDVFIGTSPVLLSSQTTISHVSNATTLTLNNLASSTYYYVWYRSSCAVGNESFWVGPLKFMTLCTPFNMPFTEDFNSTSTTFGCWKVIDANQDATTDKMNIWKLAEMVDTNNLDAMSFEGGKKKHNDYLVSPSFILTGGTYKIVFDYKTGSTKEDVDVLLSTSGIIAANFTQVIETGVDYLSGNYKRKTLFLTGVTGDANLAWHVKTDGKSEFYVDNFSISKLDCIEPTAVNIDKYGATSTTISWDDNIGTSWEYYVQPSGYGMPSTAGVLTTTKQAIFNTEANGTPLVAGTEYEFYVRTKCSNGSFGDWVGPVSFKTLCTTVASFPFTESFNTTSSSLDCWTILDHSNDASTDGLSRVWRTIKTGTYEGDGAMYFTGAATPNNDWLITPTVLMNATKMYEVSFYYKTNKSKVDVTLLASKAGINVKDFSVIEASTVYESKDYVKKVFYLENLGGEVNLAVQVNSSSSSTLYIDQYTINETSCQIPDPNVVVSNLTPNSATINWVDTTSNTSWETYTQPAGASLSPIGGGIMSVSKSTVVTKLNTTGGGNLLPNTDYEFFVRGSCGAGKKSSWVGPIKFRTPCAAQALPFFEGFNSDSPTFDCWAVGNTVNSATNFAKYDYDSFEGDKHMKLIDYYGDPMNHYLISPSFTLTKSKIYQISFQYKASSYYHNEYEVSLSTNGPIISEFKTVLSSMKVYNAPNWKQKIAYVSGIDGDVNIAIHSINGASSTENNIDAFEIKEVTCTQPIDLEIKNLKDREVTLTWEDKFNSSWEYEVIKSPSTIPSAPKGAGTATTTQNSVVKKDNLGNNLEPNTRYVYYVRSKCSATEFSEWIGPFEFFTECGVQQYPFWDGFNSLSKTMRCWTIIDVGGDGDSYTGKWNQYNYSMFEGDRAMYFNAYSSSTATHDDWLITPEFTAVSTKYYRLKYHYRATSSYENKLEVKLSTNGTNPTSFTQTLVPLATYTNYEYKQVTKFFTGINGSFNIGFHALGEGGTTLYIDNVFIEEVQGCPEPLNIAISNITKDKATVSWTDDFGATKWEYYVQKSGVAAPLTSVLGTATTTKQNVISKEQNGTVLLPGNEYDVYVRTVCGNGEYSIWQGPVEFMTTCDTFNLPLLESFDTNSTTVKCWTIIDNNNDQSYWAIDKAYPYEGDRAASLDGDDTNDDWLISPTVKMTTANYVLKFRYQTGSSATAVPMEVLLSNNGTNITEFKRTLIARKTYSNKNYVEEVLFFTGTAGDVNIAWHVATQTSMEMNIDNVSLKEVKSCPEPYNVKTNNSTAIGFDVEWLQIGGITSWEVLILKKGDPITATPIQTIQVTGNPKVTVTGLNSGHVYTIYVRANCSTLATSDWSTFTTGSVKVGANDECSQALIIPISNGELCQQRISSSLYGASPSSIAKPDCNTRLINDIWFEFIATSNIHALNISELISASGAAIPTINGALYNVGCTSITSTNAALCFDISSSSPYQLFTSLIIGQKYYVRLGTKDLVDISFDICITTPDCIKVDDTFSAEKLVKDVLVVSNCNLVSNINSVTGSDFGESNGIGYFTNTNPNLAFKEGIILATNGVEFAAGPGDGPSGNDTRAWLGDADLNKILLKNGQNSGNNNASVLEFDFFATIDELSFNFIFASEEYGNYQCDFADVFAFILTDLTTGEETNLAVVPNTTTPIAVTTIRDSKYNSSCGSLNEEYFDKYYDEGKGILPLFNPINYKGRTVPLKAKSVVIPGRKYHIKLAIADYSDYSFDSAVFLEAGSFNLGTLDLGADLLVETGNALCDGEPQLIKSGLSGDADLIEIEWYKDGILIPGVNSPDYSVSESGTYKVIGTYKEINCPIEGEVKVEIFPLIHSVVDKHSDVVICRYTLDGSTIDLTADELKMFTKSKREDFEMKYYRDADLTDLIVDPTQYGIEKENVSHTVYLHIQNVLSGCTEVFSFELISTKGEVPTQPENVLVCGQYVLPELGANQKYYTESSGHGVQYKAGDTLLAGKYTMYILQDNSNGCFEETSYEIEVTAKPSALIFEDQLLSCALYTLKALDEFSKYYIEVGGVRMEMPVGTVISKTNTKVYVVAKSENGVCVDESSFMVRYDECPIPKGISPNGDGINDNFDLTEHSVSSIKIFNRNGTEVYSFQGLYTKEWYGQTKSGNELPSGTYYYVIQSFDKTRTGWVELIK